MAVITNGQGHANGANGDNGYNGTLPIKLHRAEELDDVSHALPHPSTSTARRRPIEPDMQSIGGLMSLLCWEINSS